MFNKKNEKIFLTIMIILFVINILVLLIVPTFYDIKELESGLDPTLDIAFKISTLSIIFIPIIYFIIRNIYLQWQTTTAFGLIESKQYDKLAKLAQKLLTKNKNLRTNTLFAINLVYQKKYDEFFKFYSENQKSMNFIVFIYSTLVDFIYNDRLDFDKLSKSKMFSYLQPSSTLVLLIKKLQLLEETKYNEVLALKTKDSVKRNEFYLYIFMLCDFKAKAALNMDTTFEQTIIESSYFNQK